MVSVTAWLGGLSCPPPLLGAPPHSLGPEGAVFSVPSSRHLSPGSGFAWDRGVSVSFGSGYLRCVHTSPHDIQGLPFSASLSCPCACDPCPGVPRPENLQVLSTLTVPVETWSLGGLPMSTFLLY